MAKKSRKSQEIETTNEVVSADAAPAVVTAQDTEPEDDDIPEPVIDRAIRPEKPAEPPARPDGYQVGDRVSLPDYGSRAGVIRQIDGDLLLVELDVPTGRHAQNWAITQRNDNGTLIRTRMVEIEKSRAHVEAGSRKSA